MAIVLRDGGTDKLSGTRLAKLIIRSWPYGLHQEPFHARHYFFFDRTIPTNKRTLGCMPDNDERLDTLPT